MDALYAQVLPHLPPTLRDILLDPPSFSRPQSWIPVIRAIIPYTQYIIVILAFYIVWTTLRGVAGYATRFIRFALRLGPIIGLIGWIMSNSGQGDLGDVMNAVKEYVGLSTPTHGARKPGVEALFGGGKRQTRRSSAQTKKSDFEGLADILGSATGAVNEGDDLGDVVKRFVRDAVGKASGLDWLLGTNNQDATKGKGKGTGKGRSR